MVERAHRFPIRVYYEDTDAAGIVYHAQYLCFCERARTEFLRALGLDHQRLRHEHDLVFVVRRASLDFKRAAKLDDQLDVLTQIESIKGARVVMLQWIEHSATTLIEARIELALVGSDLRPRRLRGAIADLFHAWTSDTPVAAKP